MREILRKNFFILVIVVFLLYIVILWIVVYGIREYYDLDNNKKKNIKLKKFELLVSIEMKRKHGIQGFQFTKYFFQLLKSNTILMRSDDKKKILIASFFHDFADYKNYYDKFFETAEDLINTTCSFASISQIYKIANFNELQLMFDDFLVLFQTLRSLVERNLEFYCLHNNNTQVSIGNLLFFINFCSFKSDDIELNNRLVCLSFEKIDHQLAFFKAKIYKK